MPLFEPKIYRKNGLEAFRLIGSDGSEFFYEGALDCDEKELYKDTLGRLYYPVNAEIGSAVKYYVELEPQVPDIPAAAQDPSEKAISRLVNASPRTGASLPEDLYVRPEAAQELPLETPQEAVAELPPETPQEDVQELPPETPQEAVAELPPETPQAAPEETQPAAPAPAEKPAEPAAAAPLPEPVEHVKREEAASAIHAVFAPKVDVLHPPAEKPDGAAGPETKKPSDAPPAKEPAKAVKKRSLKWPLVIAIIVLALLAASAVGVYVIKPQTYDGLRSLFKGSTPTPVPTAVPTEEPTPTPTPTPTPAPDEGAPSASITEQIDSNSPALATFAQDHLNATYANNQLRQACDLFSLVNAQWKYTDSYPATRKASEILATMDGTSRDYSVLLTALLRSQGIVCRLVFSYPYDNQYPNYYPEVLVANTSAGYQRAVSEIQQWYNVSSPQGHSDDTGYWIALSMGDVPGIRPADAATEYALNGSTISPLR